MKQKQNHKECRTVYTETRKISCDSFIFLPVLKFLRTRELCAVPEATLGVTDLETGHVLCECIISRSLWKTKGVWRKRYRWGRERKKWGKLSELWVTGSEAQAGIKKDAMAWRHPMLVYLLPSWRGWVCTILLAISICFLLVCLFFLLSLILKCHIWRTSYFIVCVYG